MDARTKDVRVRELRFEVEPARATSLLFRLTSVGISCFDECVRLLLPPTGVAVGEMLSGKARFTFKA